MFQLESKTKNVEEAINAGGQRTEGSIIKQGIRSIVKNSEYKYSKEDICNVDEKTFRRFFETARLDTTVHPKILSERDFISVGSSHKKLYTETIFYEAGLEYGKDYEEIVFNGCEFPTCMVSPTAVPKLISYLHI